MNATATAPVSAPASTPATPAPVKGKGNKKVVKGNKKVVKGKGSKPKPPPAKTDNRGVPTETPLKVGKVNAKCEVSEAASGATRATWNGHTITSVLRWCGWKGWNYTRAVSLLVKLGIPTRPNTVKNQLGSGKRGPELSHFGPPAELTKVEAAELAKLAPEA